MKEEFKPVASLANLTVMIVDDDAMVRFIIIEYLKAFGFKKILEGKNGSDALKYLRDYDQPIDLIISDWQMPRMDGHVLLKAVRSDPIRAPVKFIMITSQASQERFKINRAKLLSVDGYIIKPFLGDVFRDKVLQVLGITDAGSQSA